MSVLSGERLIGLPGGGVAHFAALYPPIGTLHSRALTGHDALMSFDIFLQSFRDGDGSSGDGEAVLELLEPVVVRRENVWALIATVDGGADVYGLDNAATGLMVNHVSGMAMYALLYDIAR